MIKNDTSILFLYTYGPITRSWQILISTGTNDADLQQSNFYFHIQSSSRFSVISLLIYLCLRIRMKNYIRLRQRKNHRESNSSCLRGQNYPIISIDKLFCKVIRNRNRRTAKSPIMTAYKIFCHEDPTLHHKQMI